jgi:6-phosphogluconolactonase/glucosamine-6-phosphate isomerase/deaminase
MVELLKQAKQKYKNKDVVQCLADKRKYVLKLDSIHIYAVDEIWGYSNDNNSIQLYSNKKWAKIISTKQNIYELW